VKLGRKVAIITGAAAGIGEATARLFAREGARLVLVDLDGAALSKLIEELEASTIILEIVGDVADRDLCRSVLIQTAAQFGHLDILFNNAGITSAGTLVECSETEWDRVLAVNLKSMYLLSRGAVPMMRDQGAGTIINMSSIAGPTGVANRGAYSVSKAGIIGLTKSLAVDFLKDGIRVNCICPGPIDTPLLQRVIASAQNREEARKMMLKNQPMGRLGTPQEIAAMALFLASDDSRFMTGQAIFMDGGLTL